MTKILHTTDEEQKKLHEDRMKRFRILVCIDGSDESYNSLRYAAKIGRGQDADILLLYIRPIDHEMYSEEIQLSVENENMLRWKVEIPGIKYLKKGRDILIELGHMSKEWEEIASHTDVEKDQMGDNKIEYRSDSGKSIILKLKTAPDIASGILDQYDLGPYNLIILGASGRWRGLAKSFWDPAVAEKVAIHAPCSVLVARELEIGHGHLICTDGSNRSLEMVKKNATLAARCGCPISLMSVAMDEECEADAIDAVNKAEEVLKEMNMEVAEKIVRVGNPVEEIIEAGPDYSLIVVCGSAKSGLRRFFMGSVSFKVMEKAYNSVMIAR